KLVAATAPFAVYFPDTDLLDTHRCRKVGHELQQRYFEEAVLLMSTTARDAYFWLAIGLTRASTAETLAADRFPNIDHELLKDYRGIITEYYKPKQLNLESPKKHDVDEWPFGPIKPSSEDIERVLKKYHKCSSEDVERALKMKDYVFLQQLSSLLRTSLSDDLLSRRRPH